MAVLTIFNHGTGVDSSQKNHNITKLFQGAKEAMGPEYVLCLYGVGSGAQAKAQPIGGQTATKIGGNFFGMGTDALIQQATRWVKERERLGITVELINICGYSRGGASCFKQANQFWREGVKAPVRIFALDPVPGCMGRLNSHMYVDLELNDTANNVVELMIMLAECERRKTFQPVLDRSVIRGDKPDTFRWDSMPGNHCGIVEQQADVDSPFLVFDIVKKFLNRTHPTVMGGREATKFDDPSLMGDEEILGRYSKVMLEFDEYVKMGQGIVNKLMGGGLHKNRAPREKTGDGQGPAQNKNWTRGQTVSLISPKAGKSTRFFANRHHRDLFRQRYAAGFEALEKIELGGRGDLLQEAKNAIDVPTSQWGSYLQQHLNKYFQIIEKG